MRGNARTRTHEARVATRCVLPPLVCYACAIRAVAQWQHHKPLPLPPKTIPSFPGHHGIDKTPSLGPMYPWHFVCFAPHCAATATFPHLRAARENQKKNYETKQTNKTKQCNATQYNTKNPPRVQEQQDPNPSEDLQQAQREGDGEGGGGAKPFSITATQQHVREDSTCVEACVRVCGTNLRLMAPGFTPHTHVFVAVEWQKKNMHNERGTLTHTPTSFHHPRPNTSVSLRVLLPPKIPPPPRKKSTSQKKNSPLQEKGLLEKTL